jgi:hypothetical protein
LNAADNRVFELLDKKLSLFDGVFGASDEVLGAIGSGVDFEKRILDIYQSCRSEAEIHKAFDALQSELSGQIQQTMLQARSKLLENFDDEVRQRLRTRGEAIKKELTAFDIMFLKFVSGSLNIKQHEYENSTYYLNIASFPPEIIMNIHGDVNPGRYYIGKGKGDDESAIRLHLGHPLVRAAIRTAKEFPVEKICSLKLSYSEAGHKITALEPYLGKAGYCFSHKLTFKGLEEEDHLLHLFLVDNGDGWEALSNDLCDKMMTVTSVESEDMAVKEPPAELMESALKSVIDDLLKEIGLRNEDYFEREMDKLETYSEEAVLKMQDDLKKIEDAWKEAKKKRQKSLSFEDRMAARKEVQRLEQEYSKMVDKIAVEKKKLFEEKDQELKSLEKKLKIKVERELIARAVWRME